MPRQVTHYRVFIATPGGLEAERRTFRSTLNSHNEADAIARSCFFEPVGWEITLGGMGRPQEKINQDLAACDYFVLVLWNRWGSPSGADGATSGTYEEYLLARKLLKSRMREIVVFFKGIEPTLLADPGPQLSKVIEFKRSLEDSKELLFETFDTADSFSDKLKRHLAEWTRVHENKAGKTRTGRVSREVDTAQDDTSNSVDEARGSSYVDLEKQLAFDMTNMRTMQSFERYGKFLMQQERFADAERVYREMFEIASSADDRSWSSTALARVAGAYRSQGKLREAMDALQTALRSKREVGDRIGEAMVLTYLGDMYAATQKAKDALHHYREALRVNPDPSDRTLAGLKWKLARCLADVGDAGDAELMAEEALQLAKKSGLSIMVQSIGQWRKSRRRRVGKHPGSRGS